ncbi:PREDICTED: uncharacterized protein LOC104804963 [Tarenaya hassleriana]|uniref:uncharacterized protein LOC104804963 n=1 Tax=Tarenaya hassleriana TaxID=28532 RepID=UPI00053C5AF4|nr:PREDICTED: uncharacterized protein LOC104804963 [Tarenaya hassleriana]
MQRFFSPHRTQVALNNIHSFKQDHGETLHEAWKRYKGYQMSYPHHGLDKNYLANTFLRGLRSDTRTLIRASCGGSISNMSFTELEQHINQMAREEDSPLESIRDMPRRDSDAKLQLVLDELTSLKSKLANASFVSSASASGDQQVELALCEGVEDVNYVENNPYSNTYNPGWRNHPNFSYKNNNALNPPQNNYRPMQNQNQRIPPGFAFQPRAPQMQNLGQIQNQPNRHPVQNFRAPAPPLPQQDGDSEIRTMLAQLLQGQKMQETVLHSLKIDQEEVKNQMESMQAQVDGMQSHLKLLDNQITQMASTSLRPSGSLPGKSETNPREHCKAIALRSSKQLEETTPPMMEQGKSSKAKEVGTEEAEEVYVPPPPRPPPIPFPSRLKKHNEDRQFARFAEMLKTLEITMPFTEAILQMSYYTKFLKDILTKKRVVEKETVSLNIECSALIRHELPPKRADPRSFSIPCKLGNVSIDRVLCDLGASVSLLPLSIFKKLNVGELKPTRMALQLADRSVKFPAGY